MVLALLKKCNIIKLLINLSFLRYPNFNLLEFKIIHESQNPFIFPFNTIKRRENIYFFLKKKKEQSIRKFTCIYHKDFQAWKFLLLKKQYSKASTFTPRCCRGTMKWNGRKREMSEGGKLMTMFDFMASQDLKFEIWGNTLHWTPWSYEV